MSSRKSQRRVLCSQIGAREHYAVPRALAKESALEALLTDFWTPHVLRSRQVFRPLLGGAVERHHPELTAAQVVSLASPLAFLLRSRRGRRRSVTAEFEEFLRIGRRFGEETCRWIARRSRKMPELFAFFSYNTGALEPLEYFRETNVITLVDQIDPGRVEEEIVHAESLRWPGWVKDEGRIPSEYFDRLSAEWSAAQLVVVNSEWSKSALVKQGVEPSKIRVIPLAYEAPVDDAPAARRPGRPLTVLWLGQVILRKGIQYLVEAARLLEKEPVRFIIAGRIGISEDAVRSAPGNMSFVGPVSRERASEYYRRADLFVLPTLSDGFAITQVEAMAHGLPVVATPRCGAVVEEGSNGRIVPAGDSNSLANAMREILFDEDLRSVLSRNALMTAAAKYSIAALSGHLMKVLAEATIS